MNRRALLAWAALLASLFVVMILCVHWEPVARDGWSNVYWNIWNKVSADSIWHLLKDGWLGSNPRLGQTLTTVLYAKSALHSILTPILELGLTYLMAAIVLGRWPSVRRADDALVFVTTFAVFAATTPQFGPMLFYRPFMGNYTFGLLLNIAWLVPYRFFVARPRVWHWWWAPLLMLLGAAAGMCNEHTGPAFLGLGAATIVWSVKARHGVKPWMIAGLVGLLAGYLLLLMAPGHDARYAGLAKEAGIVGRIIDRGVGDNALILGRLALYMLWALPWIAVGVIGHRTPRPERSRTEWWALVALGAGGVVATAALLGSPKIGPRLYVHSTALLSMAVAGGVVMQLSAPWARKACAALSIATLLYAEVRCLITYSHVGPIGAARLTAIQTAPKGSNIIVEPYGYGSSKWFIGEDFVADNLRIAIAADYGLGRIDLSDE